MNIAHPDVLKLCRPATVEPLHMFGVYLVTLRDSGVRAVGIVDDYGTVVGADPRDFQDLISEAYGTRH